MRTNLSDRYDEYAYRASRRRPPTWGKLSASAAKSAMCAECVQLQHETRNAAGPRTRPTQTRSSGGTELVLCVAHAESWRERDRDDTR